MTLAWMLASSIAWGLVLCLACLLLQQTTDASGRARQWIWRAAGLLLVAPWIAAPLVSWLNLGLAPAPETLTMTVTGEFFVDEPVLGAPVAAGAPISPRLEWEQLLFLILAAGWIVRFVAAQLASRSLGGIIASSLPAEPGMARDAVVAWARRLKLRRTPDLRIVEAGVSPFSFGMIRPVVCLPHDLERELDAEALHLVVGHECLHVARGDGWLRPIERIIGDVFWFNPFAWRIRRELDMARELACDEAVVEVTAARKAYARTLREVAGFAAGLSYSAPAASMSLAGGGRSLILRVSRTLAHARRRPARTAAIGAVVLGLIGAPVALAQVVLATPRAPAPPAPPEMPATHIALVAHDLQETPQAPPAPAVLASPPSPPSELAAPAPQDPGNLVQPPAPATPLMAPTPPTPPVFSYSFAPGISVSTTKALASIFGTEPVDVKTTFPARVESIASGPMGSQTVNLVQTADDGATKGCKASIQLLSKVSVKEGQQLAKDETIGVADKGASVQLDCEAIELGKRTLTGDDANNVNMWFYGAGKGKSVRVASPTILAAPDGKGFAFATPGQPIVPPALMIAPRAPNAPGTPVAPYAYSWSGTAPLVIGKDGELLKDLDGKKVRFGQPATARFAGKVTKVVKDGEGSTVVISQTGAFLKGLDMDGENCVQTTDGVVNSELKAGDTVKAGQHLGISTGKTRLKCKEVTLERARYTPQTPAPPAAVRPATPAVPAAPPSAAGAPAAAPLAAPSAHPSIPTVLSISAPETVLRSGARVTSGFGYRTDPLQNKTLWHDGVDLAHKFGEDIHAPAAGVVTFAGEKGSYGRVVEVDVGQGRLTRGSSGRDVKVKMRFGHLQEVKVKEGDKVKAGDVVGLMGSTGTGAHLHYEVFANGKSYDPTLVEGLTLVAAN